VLSVAVFQRFAGLDLVDAVYFAVTIITTTGFGDINLRDAAPWLQLYAVGLMLSGTAALII
jgi:Ion channel